MTWDTAGIVTAGALSVVAAGLQLARSREGGRSAIKRDLEILGLLPPQSEAHRVLSDQVQRRVVTSVRADDETRRDPAGIAIGAACIGIGALLGFVTGRQGGWWWLAWIAAALFAVVGAVGLAISIPKQRRDAKGNQVKDEPRQL
jgi:hypothetical protein